MAAEVMDVILTNLIENVIHGKCSFYEDVIVIDLH